MRKNLEREQRSSIAEEEKIKELFADKTHIEYRDFLKYKLAMVSIRTKKCSIQDYIGIRDEKLLAFRFHIQRP